MQVLLFPCLGSLLECVLGGGAWGVEGTYRDRQCLVRWSVNSEEWVEKRRPGETVPWAETPGVELGGS